MKFEIRVATLDDLHKIQELNQMLCKKEKNEYDSTIISDWPFGEDGTKFYMNRITGDDGCVLVAVLKDEIVGYLAGGIIKSETYRIIPSMVELENMFILEEHRSSGVGKKLYDKFMQWCKTQKVNKVRVVASSKNKKGIKFYLDSGFEEYSLMMEQDL